MSDAPLLTASPHEPSVNAKRLPQPRAVSAGATPRAAGNRPGASARGWLAGATRNVSRATTDTTHHLEISGIGQFSVDLDTASITAVGIENGVTREFFEDALMGPPLAFALALRNVWCLHASAVVHKGKATLFLGASGRGKSTLAAYFDEHKTAETGRIADDITPCSVSAGQGVALPHYPQLKLDPAAQYAADAPDEVPIQAIMVLAAAGASEKMCIKPMEASRAISELVRQTVAVTLFDASLHARHLQYIAKLVQSVAVHELRYPHEYSQLPLVYDWLLHPLP